jgi:hypothetical protein
MRFSRSIFFFCALLVTSAPAAWAGSTRVPGTRSLGLGGALRGAATGDLALTLNPSGMSLLRAYVIEAAYLHGEGAGASNLGRISIADSTSGFNIAGGVYYNYLTVSSGGQRTLSGHEGGVALSIPVGEHLFIGGLAKYLRLRTGADTGNRLLRGFTFDAGITIKPASMISLGIVGSNLADHEADRASRALSGGLTVGATTDLVLALDAVLEFDNRRTPAVNDKVWHVMGGAEYVFLKRFALRAGGGHRGDTDAGYVAAGASYIAQIGALDVGFQRDLSGSTKETFIGASARLFLPSPE